MMRPILIACCLLLAGCAESIELFHHGDKLLQRHIVPPSWHAPGKVLWTKCWPKQLIKSVYWGKMVCPDDDEPNTPLAVLVGNDRTASYAELVVPGAVSGALIGGGIGGGLAAQKAAQMTQHAGSFTVNERFSTKFIEAP